MCPSLSSLNLFVVMVHMVAGAHFIQRCHDVVFAHDQVFYALNLDFRAGILAEKDGVSRFDGHGDQLAIFCTLAFAGGDDFALLGFSFALSGRMIPPLGYFL